MNFVFCLWFLLCKFCIEFIEVVEKFGAKTFCEKSMREVYENKNLQDFINGFYQCKILEQAENIVAYKWSE